MRKSLRGGAFAAGLALTISLCVSPGAAFAIQTHDISQGKVQLYSDSGCMRGGTCEGHVITGSTTDTDNKLLIESGEHNVTLNGVTIDFSGSSAWNAHAPVAVANGATLNLNLSGGNVVKAHTRWGDLNSETPGILVPSGATLTIDGTGSLEARAGSAGSTGQTGAAGIGGGWNSDFGTVIINGGKVDAYGVDGGAGIGSGYFVVSGTAHGNVTINGGFVRAYGGSRGASSAAGIGAGENGDYAGTITINGGVVHAMGGDEDQSSIGGGGRGIGASDNGTFTTGTDGNAIICAPYGIGDRSQLHDWDCILLDQNEGDHSGEDHLSYSEDPNGKVTVTFGGGTPQVYGNVKMDYNLVVNAPASLRVTTESDVDGDAATKPNPCSTLTMKSGSTLTNNNGTDTTGGAGVALEAGTKLILEDGVNQLKGDGKMVALKSSKYGAGEVYLPLTDELVTLNPETYVYDGKAKEPAVSVVFNKWGYKQAFAKDKDFEVVYTNHIDAGTAIATVRSKSARLHDQKTQQSINVVKTYQITPAKLVVSTVQKRYVVKGENQLLSKLPSMPSFGSSMPQPVKSGNLAWYSDKDCAAPLTDGFVANKDAGDTVTVYWKYTHAYANYEQEATGSTQLIITDGTPPEVSVNGETDDMHLSATYGDADKKLEIKIKLPSGDDWQAPKSDITYSVSNQTPADKGNVVSVDAGGNISFLGAGTATILAEIDSYTDPNATGDDKGDSYGPAFVTIEVEVAPKGIAVKSSSVKATDRAFDGTHDIAVEAKLDAGGIVSGDEGMVSVDAKGSIDDVNAANDVPVEVSYELTGEKADDYVLTNAPETTVDISKANGSNVFTAKSTQREIYNRVAGTYTVNLGQTIIPDPVNGMLPYVNGFKIKEVKFEKSGYFTKDDITVSQVNSVLTLKTKGVDSDYEGKIATITVELSSANFTGLTGTVEVWSKNAEIHTITAEAGPHGSISPTELKVIAGQPAELTITPDKGYEIEGLTVDGHDIEDFEQYITDGVLHIEKVTVDHHIKVTFKSDGTGGSTDPTDPQQPTDPTDPQQPTDPTDPKDPAEGEGDKGQPGDAGKPGSDSKAPGKDGDKLVATGDISMLPILAVCAMGIAALGVSIKLSGRKSGADR